MVRSPRLILASASPRRVELLRQIGLAPDVVAAAEIDESARPGEAPRALAGRLAAAKAATVARNFPADFVLAADTVVACGARVLPKAASEDEARRCLALLSGRRHRVFSGLCLLGPDGRRAVRCVATQVTFKRLSAGELEGYLASGEWLGKAGGYAIQGRAAAFVRALNGSYSSVVGLPLYETAQLLAGLGYASSPPGQAAP
jgi:septum formation protein